MSTMTITDFLTARFDEREADLRRLLDDPHSGDGVALSAMGGAVEWLARDELADVAAKRAIVRRVVGSGHGVDQGAYGLPGVAWDVLAFLAQPYAEHPDFDPAWRVA